MKRIRTKDSISALMLAPLVVAAGIAGGVLLAGQSQVSDAVGTERGIQTPTVGVEEVETRESAPATAAETDSLIETEDGIRVVR